MCVQRCRATSLGTHPTHGQVFALLCWPTVMTPSRHRRLVLAYDSNPSSDGSVLVSATPPARHHYCPPTPLRPRPHPRWQGFTRAPAQVQQQPEHVLAYTNEYLPMRSGPRAAEGVKQVSHGRCPASAAAGLREPQGVNRSSRFRERELEVTGVQENRPKFSSALTRRQSWCPTPTAGRNSRIQPDLRPAENHYKVGGLVFATPS